MVAYHGYVYVFKTFEGVKEKRKEITKRNKRPSEFLSQSKRYLTPSICTEPERFKHSEN